MIIKFLCKILGHDFGGYIDPREQRMPDYFWCKRCKHKVHVDEGWN